MLPRLTWERDQEQTFPNVSASPDPYSKDALCIERHADETKACRPCAFPSPSQLKHKFVGLLIYIPFIGLWRSNSFRETFLLQVHARQYS